MKVVKLFLIPALLGLAFSVNAQKYAHLNTQELITLMPEYDEALVALEAKQKSLEEEMEMMMVERNRKLEEYTTKSKEWSDLVRQSREQEIQQMNERMQIFQNSAQQDLQAEQNKLMQPILEKMRAAINTVAKEQGITYVFEAGGLLYTATDAIDLLPLVKANLGITK